MTDKRKTFENASPETDDVVLCLFCGETLHAPEDDVFWEGTAGHECKEMLVAEVARLTAERDALRAQIEAIYQSLVSKADDASEEWAFGEFYARILAALNNSTPRDKTAV